VADLIKISQSGRKKRANEERSGREEAYLSGEEGTLVLYEQLFYFCYSDGAGSKLLQQFCTTMNDSMFVMFPVLSLPAPGCLPVRQESRVFLQGPFLHVAGS
jgi:hypothetical protein